MEPIDLNEFRITEQYTYPEVKPSGRELRRLRRKSERKKLNL